MNNKVGSIVLLIAIVATGCNGSGNGSKAAGSTGSASSSSGSGGTGEAGGSTSKAAGTPSDPIIIKGASSLASESTATASDNVSGEDSTCIGYKTAGPDQVYKITVPGTDTTKLTVTVTPLQTPGLDAQTPGPDAYDPVVYITENIAAVPTCAMKGSDSHGGGSPEIAQYVNASAQDKDVYVVVDGYDYQMGGGSYKLVADIAAP